MIEVGEEVTREDATEEMQIAVGAEEVETSEKDFEVDMTTSEVAQDQNAAEVVFSSEETDDKEVELSVIDDNVEEMFEQKVRETFVEEFQGVASTSTFEAATEESGFDIEGKLFLFGLEKGNQQTNLRRRFIEISGRQYDGSSMLIPLFIKPTPY